MKLMKHVPVLLLLLLAVSGCESPFASPPRPQIQVTTDRETYTRKSQAPDTIPFTVTNVGRRPVYLVWCGERVVVSVEIMYERWMNVGPGQCDDGLRTQGPVQPGASVQSAHVLIYGRGRYRLVAYAAPSSDISGGDYVMVWSNAFTVQ